MSDQSNPYAAPEPGRDDIPQAPGATRYEPTAGRPDAEQPYAQPSYLPPATPPSAQPYATAPGQPYATAPGQVMTPWGPLSSWGARVGAYLLDSLLSTAPMLLLALPGMIMFIVGAPTEATTSGGVQTAADPGNPGLAVAGGLLMLVGYLGGFALALWNRVFRMGRTGQSWGKKALGIRLVDDRTGAPMGAGMCFVRELAHTLDSLFGMFPLGYLWPLWDAKRQTWADKLLTTVVVDAPKS